MPSNKAPSATRSHSRRSLGKQHCAARTNTPRHGTGRRDESFPFFCHTPRFTGGAHDLATGLRQRAGVNGRLGRSRSHAQTSAQTTRPDISLETGAINGAPFYIEVPAQWNRGLVLYAHGYTLTSATAESGLHGISLAGRVLSRGFAFAASDYSVQGWAVKEAIEDTEAVRRYFVARNGAPAETYITGHSMGGHITMAIIERYPEAYQGAMPMCGPLGAAIEFLNTGVFDMLVTFEALFPGTIGSPYEPRLETAKKVKAARAAQPERAAGMPSATGAPSDLPGALAVPRPGRRTEAARRGEPFDNRNRIYVGFGDDATLNRSVKRYAAVPSARGYVRQYATPTGRISDPISHPHHVRRAGAGQRRDRLRGACRAAGTSDRFVARFVEADGHCNFTPAQSGNTLRRIARVGPRRQASGPGRTEVGEREPLSWELLLFQVNEWRRDLRPQSSRHDVESGRYSGCEPLQPKLLGNVRLVCSNPELSIGSLRVARAAGEATGQSHRHASAPPSRLCEIRTGITRSLSASSASARIGHQS